ncbi:MAG: M3 family oligoendopeptidase [Ruminiclostridium sp.]|jgi:M3 family oligoendopeptidase|nr:M3 family oligoendopeptidase [Ruminiclostridium sp.]
MKVSELKYERLSIEEFAGEIKDIIRQVKEASSAQEVLEARERYKKLSIRLETAQALSYMRYSINTADEFYLAEKDYYDETGPQAQSLMQDYSRAMVNSPYRQELEVSGKLLPLMYRSMEVDLKSMAPCIIQEMVEENRLVSKYSQLMAGMEFEFRGEKLPRPMLMKYAKSPDRATRKEAYEVLGRTLKEHSQELDGLFDQLVTIRHRMAVRMGYKNFVELGYYRMGRLCYGPEEVKQFRENVRRDVVPVVARLREEVGKALGVDKLMLYDYDLIFPQGDPAPKGGKEEIFAAAKAMYHSMSKETGEFFDFMLDTDAFDVESRKNKWGGGYCTSFMAYHQPFILANFNGTSGDVDVVTHEAGHAFADYTIAGNEYVVELNVGGMETAETHSMSMEFFAWPYMEHFFGEDAKRYQFMHLLDSLSFLPYGTIVDDFQRQVYENPEWTPEERKAAWRKLEAEFRPHLHFEGIPYLEEGTRWQYQMHIYETPFYYIDYCLAQTAALQFLLASQKDYDGAFARYVRFLSQGGEKVFTDLLEEAGLRSPFQEGALGQLAQETEQLLEKLKADAGL